MDKRTLLKVGIISTLISKPVYGVMGLSNMLSGNTSVCTGDTMYGGYSPGFWKTPSGATEEGYVWQAAWDMTGYHYGDLIPGEQGNKFSHYSGGTKMKSVFGIELFEDLTLREMMNLYPEEYTQNGKWFHLIAGLLNARYYSKIDYNYFMTEEQYWKMYNGTIEVPQPFYNMGEMISTYYHGEPDDTCL